MGEMAEYYLEQSLFGEDWEWAHNPIPRRRTTWTTREGKILEISKMETSHIKNCINLLRKKQIPVPSEFYRVLKERGEGNAR